MIKNIVVSKHFLTDPTIQGTVKAGTGLTMPAFTSGNISLGANAIKTTNCLLDEWAANSLAIRNYDKSAYQNLKVNILELTGNIGMKTNGTAISTPTSDNSYIILEARDNGVGMTEVVRLQSGVEPYILLTHPKIGARTLPTASANFRGFMYRVEGGAGVTDYLYCCMKSAADAYNWIQIATGG